MAIENKPLDTEQGTEVTERVGGVNQKNLIDSFRGISFSTLVVSIVWEQCTPKIYKKGLES